MTKTSFLKSTLCALILAIGASTNVAAQKKENTVDHKEKFNSNEYFNAIQQPKVDTIPSIPSVGFAGFAISHFNPVISVGIKVGKNKKYSYDFTNPDDIKKVDMYPSRFSLYTDFALYAPVKPFHTAHAEFYDHGQSKLYNMGLYVRPLIRYDMLVANNRITFGGGLLLVQKKITGVPDLDKNYQEGIGFTGIFGTDITPLLTSLFPKTKDRLELEGTLSYVPKSTLSDGLNSLELSHAVDSMDKNLLRISLGMRYWIK